MAKQSVIHRIHDDGESNILRNKLTHLMKRAIMMLILHFVCWVPVSEASPAIPIDVLELKDHLDLSQPEQLLIENRLKELITREENFQVLAQDKTTHSIQSELDLTECLDHCGSGHKQLIPLTMSSLIGQVDKRLILNLKLFSPAKDVIIGQRTLSASTLAQANIELDGAVKELLEDVYRGDQERRQALWLGLGGTGVGVLSAYCWLLIIPELSKERNTQSQSMEGRQTRSTQNGWRGVAWGLSVLSAGLISWAFVDYFNAPPSSQSLIYGDRE